MIRVAAHLVGEVHQLAVDAVADELIDEPRRPTRRVPGDHPLDGLPGVQRPLERPVAQQLDKGLLPVLGEQLGQHPADRRPPLRLGDPFDDGPVDDLLDVLVVEQLHHDPQHRAGLPGHPVGMCRLGEPLAQPPGHLRVAQLGLHHGRRQEVLPHERAQALTELVLLALDDGGVRDLQSQRMAEQRGDGEPVRQRAHHAGLGGRPDVADPGRPTLGLAPPAGQEDHGRTDQETQRHRLHPAQRPAALGVGFRVRAGERLREGRTRADYPVGNSGRRCFAATPPSSAIPRPSYCDLDVKAGRWHLPWIAGAGRRIGAKGERTPR